MTEKKVACYARVSTDMQQGGMESQIRVLKTYCDQNGLHGAEFYQDEGISGTKASRPALDRMMAAVEAGEISMVIVYSFSRFARSTTHLLNALQVFKKRGVQFVSLTGEDRYQHRRRCGCVQHFGQHLAAGTGFDQRSG